MLNSELTLGGPSDLRADVVAARVEAFLRARLSADDAGFSRRSNLWDDGYLDSIGMVELIAHIESACGVVLPDEALFDPDFTSVDGIARIVSQLATQPSA